MGSQTFAEAGSDGMGTFGRLSSHERFKIQTSFKCKLRYQRQSKVERRMEKKSKSKRALFLLQGPAIIQVLIQSFQSGICGHHSLSSKAGQPEMQAQKPTRKFLASPKPVSKAELRAFDLLCSGVASDVLNASRYHF